MGSNSLVLVILYSDLSTDRVPVRDTKEARDYIHNEGDHVMEWYTVKEYKK